MTENSTVSISSSDQDDDPAARSSSQIGLNTALLCGWIEFWYQPKIDLSKRQMTGAEVFARARHPARGILQPAAFMSGADPDSLATLTEQALLSALETSNKLARAGINLPITINVPVTLLGKYPFSKLVQRHRPDIEKWAGLIFDIPEQQIFSESSLIAAVIEKLRPHGIKFAADDFGRSLSSMISVDNFFTPANEPLEDVLKALEKLGSLGVVEMKLDRSFVTDSNTDRRSASICKAMIDLAHALGTKVVGIGVEKSTDLETLVQMGCDIGQGFVFGQPMTQDEFVRLLRGRAEQLGRRNGKN